MTAGSVSESVSDDLVFKRNTTSFFGRFLAWAMPTDPRPVFVWPMLAHTYITRQKGRMLRFGLVAAGLMALTMGLIYLLSNVAVLNYSVVKLLQQIFTFVVPGWLAGWLAWGVGITLMIAIGGFTQHTPMQKRLSELPASSNGFYSFWLRMALWEEMAFRTGAEKWKLVDRLRASLVFGCIHITNIWYSFAAGIALSMTGLAFMMVYLWEYRRTKNQMAATAASGTVHALYNSFAMILIGVVVLYALCSLVMSWFGVTI